MHLRPKLKCFYICLFDIQSSVESALNTITNSPKKSRGQETSGARKLGRGRPRPQGLERAVQMDAENEGNCTVQWNLKMDDGWVLCLNLTNYYLASLSYLHPLWWNCISSVISSIHFNVKLNCVLCKYLQYIKTIKPF